MKLKTWFTNSATVTQAALARFAEVELDEVREIAKELGSGPRLTLAQSEEIVASLAEETETEEDGDSPDDDEADDAEEDGTEDDEDQDETEDDGDEDDLEREEDE
jgi:hypothetical protein